MKNILMISGSLRAKSYNTALLRAFATALEAHATIRWADIDLPLFNEELEVDFPAAAKTLRQQVLAADVIIISTPEYNWAMSGPLKNAIDWVSRPAGENAWPDKKVFVASVSKGALSGINANLQVRKSLNHLGAKLYQREFLVGHAADKFDESGMLTDEKTQEYVKKAVQTILET